MSENSELNCNSGIVRRILVTGGTGTLGYNILRRLAQDGRYHVIAPVRRVVPELARAFPGSVQFIEHDLSDAIHTAQIFERAKPEITLHCAATGLRAPKGSWFDLMQFNVVTAMRLFQMNCRLDQPSHFIYVSTGLVYREQGRPLRETDPVQTLHPYGASKAATDTLLQAAAAEFKRKLTILRPFAFTGLHDGGKRLFPLILEAAMDGRRQGLTAGTQIRDYCAVGDIAEAIHRVIEREGGALIEKFNLGSGLCLPLRNVIERVCEALALKVDLAFGEVPPHPFEPQHSVADLTHSAAELGWKPSTSLAYAVWELAKEIAPSLKLKQPERDFEAL